MMHLTQNRAVAASRKVLALGVLLAALVAAMLLISKPAHAQSTFTVTNTNDSGKGSLRDAILYANVTDAADVIKFNIPGNGPHTISPVSELPEITSPVTINGYSQPGAKPNTLDVGNDAVLKIVLRGDSAQLERGLRIRAADTTVKGLVINRWATDGITISGSSATGNKVTGNYIGTDALGTTGLGNFHSGVSIYDGPNNTVGGTTAGERNVISANTGNGVKISGNNASGNKVVGNYLGTDASGTRNRGNDTNGVFIDNAPNNAIGGTTVAERNVISANTGDGVQIYGNGSTGNEVVGNFVGTDATGTKDLGNGYLGVYIWEAPNNAIGGTQAGERNVISGNDDEGVAISGNGATGNEVLGNYVGTDKFGTAPLGNAADGLEIDSASGNTIGGTLAEARNLISGNGSDGVEVTGDSAKGNRILSNSIFSNTDLGIDLEGNEGPTANDPGDEDTGPNNLQNKPSLTSAKTSRTSTTVRGTQNSTLVKSFRLQFFSNPSGNEGKIFIGQKSVTTDANGDVSFTFTPAQKVGVGRTVTATATGPGGNNSEFSAARTVVAQ